MKKKVLLIGNFKDTDKNSMKDYENKIYNNLCQNSNFTLELYRPKQWIKSSNKLLIILQYFFELIFKRNFALYHILDHSLIFVTLLFKKEKILTTIHDIIPIVNELEINRKRSFFFRNLIFFINRSNKIITISETTKQDLLNNFNLNKKKICVIYNGISNSFYKIEHFKNLSIIKNLKSTNRKVLIFLNRFYKNNFFSLEVIKQYENDYNETLDLVCVGSSYQDFENKVKFLEIKSKIYYFRNLKINEINELYNLCDCLLFPSINEGFGIPPIESMKAGTPVMCSNVTIFRETIGWGYPLYDIDVLIFSKNLRKILHDNNFKNILVNKGFKVQQKYSETDQIQKHLDLYNELLR